MGWWSRGREELRKPTHSVLVPSDSIEDIAKTTGVRQLCITVAKYQTQATYGIKGIVLSLQFSRFRYQIFPGTQAEVMLLSVPKKWKWTKQSTSHSALQLYVLKDHSPLRYCHSKVKPVYTVKDIVIWAIG